MGIFVIFAFVAGVAIAIQASLNAQLGSLIRNPLWAAGIAFFVSCVFILVFIALTSKPIPELELVKKVPFYLWFTGGALSAFAVAMFYFLIPKMGMGVMMSYALSGQMLIAIVSSHYGWFNLPEKPIDMLRASGLLALIVGIVLINWESDYGN